MGVVGGGRRFSLARTMLREEEAKKRWCGVHLRGGSLGWTRRVGPREMRQLISQRNRILIYENAN
jgi:hypothetical protein